MIPQTNPRAEYLTFKDELDEAIRRVLHSGHYILGDEVATFESAAAQFLNVPYAVGVASGTDALRLALLAGGLRPGDEVITVANTATATVSALVSEGLQPAFVDIDPETLTLDPALVAAALTTKTKALIVVHLFGNPAAIADLKRIATEHQLLLIEDCAQSFGATFQGRCTGTFGDFGCFSFYPTKNLSAIGDGGMIVTHSAAAYEKLLLLRQYGWQERNKSLIHGINSRLDEIQAAILNVKLKYIAARNQQRAALAQLYRYELATLGCSFQKISSDAEHVFHQCVIHHERRDELKRFLEAQDIMTAVHYPLPIYRMPAYQRYAPARIPLHTERSMREILSLPLFPELTAEEIKRICEKIKEFSQHASLAYGTL